jgi:hypothetical protein
MRVIAILESIPIRLPVGFSLLSHTKMVWQIGPILNGAGPKAPRPLKSIEAGCCSLPGAEGQGRRRKSKHQGRAQTNSRPVQGLCARRAVRHGRGGTGAADRVAANPRAQFAAQAQRDLPSFLAVRCGCRSHYADGRPAHCLRMDPPSARVRIPAIKMPLIEVESYPEG